eukprot:5964396-Amphidinium_carterae.1
MEQPEAQPTQLDQLLQAQVQGPAAEPWTIVQDECAVSAQPRAKNCEPPDKQFASTLQKAHKGHMFTGTIVGRHISHTVPLQISELHTPLFRISIRLAGFHPHDLDPSRKRSQGPAFKVSMPAFRLAAASTQSMHARNHTFAIANKPLRLALFTRPDGSQEFRSIDRLL